MNILWSIHLYPPVHNCGAEFVAVIINRELIKRGHSVKIILHQANQHKITQMYDFEGAMVFPPDQNTMESLFRWSDIVLTHLDYTKFTVWEAAKYGKPCFHLTHNDSSYPSIVDGVGDIRIIQNSQWIANKLQYKWPTIIFPPAVDDWYKTSSENRKYITLIGMSQNKGIDYFVSWALKMPQYNFLAVKGSYENQRDQNLPMNLTVWPNTPDIRKVYEVTKILCVPSHYESWGRVASEAMINGIPVIASPTDGLKENLDYAGIFANRKDSARVMEEITKLMEDPEYYKKWSDLCLKRAGEQIPDWDGLEKFLLTR